MGSTTTADVKVRSLTASIGAEIRGVDLANAPDHPEVMELVNRALTDHLVLFFRDQHNLTPDQQIRFAGQFGPFEYHAFAKPHPDHRELVVLDQTTPERDGSNSWHTDSTFMAQPAWGSVLRAVLLPYLLQHVQRPDYQVRFQWEPGAVALWDNRCTQHYAVPDYSGHRRVMHRVTLTGEQPLGVATAS